MALYSKTELEKSTIAELKTLAKENDIELEKGWKKADLVEALLEVEEPEDDIELDDELDEELDEELPDEDDEEDETIAFQEKVKAQMDAEYEAELAEEEDELPEPTKAKKSTAKKPAKEKKNADGETTLAAKQVATLLSQNLGMTVEAKTLRQFFRSPASTVEAVGSGGRYEFLETDVPTIEKEFKAWKEGHASRGTKRTGGGRGRKGNEPVEIIEEVEEIEELEIEDDDLDDIDDEDLELEEED